VHNFWTYDWEVIEGWAIFKSEFHLNFKKIIVKFEHALVILGKPIVSRINEDHLGKKFNVSTK